MGAPGALALAALAGVAHTAAFAPLDLPWLQVLAVVALVALVQTATPAQAFARGWAFGTAWLTSGLWWLYISLHDFGGLPSPLAAVAVLLLSLALSLYLALALAAWARWRSRRPLADALGFAGLWLLAELARAQFLTGFPWIASGYAHADGLLAMLAPWGGVYAMGALAALLAALVVLGQGSEARLNRLLAVALLGGLYLLPQQFTEPAGELTVSLLQPAVPQDLKFDPARINDNMQALQRQLHAARGALVVTPESVLPVPRDLLDEGYWAGLTAPFRQPGRAALVGTFIGNERDGYVNAMVGVQAGSGPDYEYGKRHLLPFGEYIPPGFRWFVELMRIPLGDQASGHNSAAFAVAGQRVRPLICYEDLFGEDFADAVVGPQAATVLVNASNLAWFGRWMVQDQHLQFSRLRALEFQRPLVRATNTGATAVIDHRGVVTHRLPAWQEGTLDASVQGRRGDTPYARWLARAGLWPLWVLALALFGAMAPAVRRR
ncbi:apolipoprotein N-acyltransferase [Ideonella sp. 4Y11]|uniref:Apolipoprotein N-acyltransferase n=1 Tax=Ideonella aquatica TaxID=2824119 RepID=A0A941BQP1_9BURK|nr:apolipoprotein N-acyltransferase [Ideonella aquatica]